ncbi:tetraacyldisaccharide 4'-kinase [Oligoflexaceae bacterium]|nr:tetraacyldisaccharide 4'-kinase [Oligoflexaceae bacterium]
MLSYIRKYSATSLDPKHIPSFARFILLCLSKIYGVLVTLRNFAFRKKWKKIQKLPGRTISIGNLVVGGTGKSPFVIHTAKYLQSRGFRPAIVARGYKSHLSKDESMVLLNGEVLISPERSKKAHPDEAMMQSQELNDVPIVVGGQRYEAVQRFLKHKPEISDRIDYWILDDGFQHQQLARDFDIVLLDSQSPVGNDFLLPLGTLREPVSGVKRATALFYTRSDEDVPNEANIARFKKLGFPDTFFAPMIVDQPLLVKGQAKKSISDPATKVAIVSAIARPERFLDALHGQGVTVSEKYFLPDHWTFEKQKLERLAKECDALVTTAKDYWRDPLLFSEINTAVYILPIYFKIESEDLAKIYEEKA